MLPHLQMAANSAPISSTQIQDYGMVVIVVFLLCVQSVLLSQKHDSLIMENTDLLYFPS